MCGALDCRSMFLQGALSFVVQTSAATNSLPAQAVNVQGGTVTSTSPVQGSNGSLFNVNVNTAAGASFLTIGTVAGVGLANGLLTTSSNTLRIDLMSQNPQASHTPRAVKSLTLRQKAAPPA